MNVGEAAALFAVLGEEVKTIVAPKNEQGNSIGIDITQNDVTGETQISLKVEPQSDFTEENNHIILKTNEKGELYGLGQMFDFDVDSNGLKKTLAPDGSVLLSLKLEDSTQQTTDDGHIQIKTNKDGQLYIDLTRATFPLIVNFLTGLNIGNYFPNESGGTIRMVDGNSVAEIDILNVRKRANFKELVIEKLSHIGGETIQSPANMVCNKVEVYDTHYRCFFDKGDNGEVSNMFETLDQAKCQVFTGSALKYYWRLVVGIGEDYIDLSIADCDTNSDVPAIGDNICQLGHRTNTDRQNAIIQSSIGEPSYKQYAGIHTYSLEGCEQTVLAPSGNKIVGKLSVKSGNIIKRVPCDREAWSIGMECNYYDRVSHLGALWLCVIPDGTTTTVEPSLTSEAWQKQVSEGEAGVSPINVSVVSVNGNMFHNRNINTTLIAYVYQGTEDITGSLNQNCFRWVRASDDPSADAAWNSIHANYYSNILSITVDDVFIKAVFNCVVTINN